MFNPIAALTDLDVKLAIIRHPLMLPPETLVTDAIAAMNRHRVTGISNTGTDHSSSSQLKQLHNSQQDLQDLHLETHFSCVLVTEASRLVGIFSRRDMVRLIAQQYALERLRLADVMIRKVISLPEIEFTNVFVATGLLQKYRIRNLPTVDADGRITGIITHESLCQIARPVDLLRVRQVQEVMTSPVVWTRPEATILEVTRLMHQHRVSSVVIAQPDLRTDLRTDSGTDLENNLETDSTTTDQITDQITNQVNNKPNHSCSSIKPIGIITERDLVQFHALGLAVEEYNAAQIMSSPVFTILPEEHLWNAQQIMTQRMIRSVIVVDQQHNLQGIITHTSLLRVLDPTELYKLAEVLETRVNQLESEKVRILAQRTEDLEREVQERTHKLELTLKREKIINRVAQRIRNSLDLHEILNACVMEVQRFLDCDRVIVYQCGCDRSGVVIAESGNPNFDSLLGIDIPDNYCEKETIELMNDDGAEAANGQVIVDDIDSGAYPQEQIAFFNRYQVKAGLMTPIRLDGKLWGLLAAQQCQSSRQWYSDEAELLSALAVQLSIGIRQSIAYTEMEQQVTESRLWRKRYEAAASSSGQLIYEYDHRTGKIIWGAGVQETLGYKPEDAPSDFPSYWRIVHPDDLPQVEALVEVCIDLKTVFHYQYRVLHQRGEYIWVEERGQWLTDPNGEAYIVVGMVSDITQRKLVEQSLKTQRDFSQLIAQITSRFVHITLAELDSEINRSLLLIGGAMEADTSFLYRLDDAKSTQTMTHEWTRDGYSSRMQLNQHLPLGICPWFQNLIAERKTCYIPDIDHAPNDAAVTVAQWRRLELKSILLVPLLQQNQVIGYIGCGSLSTPTYWEEEVINLVTVMGQSIVNAQERLINRQELETLNHSLEAEIARRIDEFQQIYSLQQAILNSFDYAIISTDINGIIRTFNAGAENFLGYSASEVIGKMTPVVFYDPQEVQDHANYLSAKLGRSVSPDVTVFTIEGAEECSEKEWTNIRKDGTKFPMRASISPLKDMDDQVIGFVSIGRDITEKKQIAEALEKSKNLFRQLFDANVVGVMFTDFSGAITDANDYFLNLIGYTREELINGQINWEALTPLAHRHKDIEAINQLQLHRAVVPWEKVYYNKQGHEVPILIGVALLEDDDDRGSCICLIIDITEQKRSEQQLRETQQFITTIINTIPLPIFWKDRQGKFLGCNRFLVELLELSSPSEIIGKTDAELSLNIEQLDDLHTNDQMVLNSGTMFLRIPEILTLPNNQKRYIETHKAPLRNSHGEIIGLVGTFQDITQRKTDEELLRLSEESFRNAFDNTTVGMCLVLTSGHFLRVNQAFANLIGYEPSQMQNMTFRDITHPDDLAMDIKSREQVLSGEISSYHVEKRYITKSGKLVWGLLSLSLVRDLTNQPLYFVTQIQDITERKQALVKLQASESRFRQIFESKVVGMVLADFQGNIINANDRFLEILGYTRREFVENEIRWDFITPQEHQEMDLTSMRHLREHGMITPWEKEYYRKDGTRVPILIGAALLPNSEDQTVCVVIDISDRKAVERALQNSEERFRQLAQAIDAVFWIMSLDRKSWVYVSPAYEKIWGRKYINLYTGTDHWLDTVHPEDRDRVRAALPQQISGDFNQEYRIIRPGGEIRWIHDRAFPMQGESSQVYLIAGIAEDITVRKVWESQLQYTNAQLARATRLKDEFLASMSHELRTPLNAILGMAEGLQEHVFGELNDRQMKSIQTIERSGTHLLALINDILDLSKVESGQVQLSLTSNAVPLLVQSGLTFIQQQARKKRIEITTKIPPQLPYVEVDQLRIHQVLINLLNNAVKFTPEGGKITVTVAYPCPPLPPLRNIDTEDLASRKGNFIRISIIDTGIGIAPENINKLFQPFVQIDSALNRQYEGTGLGLALVKRLVELHNGQINVSSEVGRGSCFTFDLPASPDTAAPNAAIEELPVPPPSDITGTPKVVLLVEDNAMTVSTISSYLKAKGYQIILASNGLEALEVAEKDSPDIILMDIQMPGMDGLEAIQRIRANPLLQKMPIIALTALAMSGDQDRCLAAGANEYMSKPVKMKELVNVIERTFDNAYVR
ncbi:MAG: PAS domain S-box protein [Pseudanabaenaceae cyanobacterium]